MFQVSNSARKAVLISLVLTCSLGCREVEEPLPEPDNEKDSAKDTEYRDTSSSTDTGKQVCCRCECLLKQGDSWMFQTKTTSGIDISCKTACKLECQREARWQLDNYANIDCDQMPDTENREDD